jgi:hypothetical protein
MIGMGFEPIYKHVKKLLFTKCSKNSKKAKKIIRRTKSPQNRFQEFQETKFFVSRIMKTFDGTE